MKSTLAAVAVLGLLAAAPAVAQTRSTAADELASAVEQAVRRSGLEAALEELAAAAAPELERVADAMGALATRVAADPALRRSASRAALGVVEVVEVVVERHSAAMIEVLREAAERIAEAAAREGRR
jgi:Skp family chaperone for outer membrane proteins